MFYAINPLILIESLVSPHNEVVMLTLVLLSIYLLVLSKKFFSLILLALSVSIKYFSVVLLPIYLLVGSDNWGQIFKAGFYLWLFSLIPAVILREPYSWYIVPVIGLAALCQSSKFIPKFSLALSAATLLRYWPFIYLGEYSSLTTTYQLLCLLFGSLIVFGISQYIWREK